MVWAPPRELSLDETVDVSERVLGMPERPVDREERLFKVQSAGLRWVVGGEVFEPRADVLTRPDGRRVGAFLLHSGGGDHRQMANLADILASRFGIKAYTFSYPGHINLTAADRSWPGEPLDDGTGHPRLPQWDPDDPIGHDEYDLEVHRGDDERRRAYGTTYVLRARPGTQFYLRQATWPLAYEESYKEACRREFPTDEFTVFLHGHSTGGPQTHMLLQRIDNVGGSFGLESSPFGAMLRGMHPASLVDWSTPFEDLALRTWRDTARYVGTESGLAAADLPMLMEMVMEEWQTERQRSGFKSEHFIQMAELDTLASAARVAGAHLRLTDAAIGALVERYHGYTRPLPGHPLPPIMYVINRYSRDHRPDNYLGSLLPQLGRLNPAPRVSFTQLGAGVHDYNRPEDGLPRGTAPVAASLWADGLANGFFDPAG